MLDGVRGDGNVMTKKRKISDDFVRIEASRGLDVYITKSRKVSLEVEADENLHELIQTEVRDGTLFITSSRNIYSASAKKVHLSTDHINGIYVNSGAEVYSENTISADKLELSVSSGSEARLDVDVQDLSCDSSSGAEANLRGKAHNFKASSSSGSNIDAYELEATNCTANASSGSDIDINVSNVFEGTASSGADISYKGNPDKVSKNNNSGGSINQVRG